jgi:4-diphosphocytidyl-2-C-methyl-D-erythritol kinase
VTTIEVRAHAKINLHLGILGRRPDGYHEVETVLQTHALHDTLTCDEYDGPFSLSCDRPGVPVDAANLVWRAAALLAEVTGRGTMADARIRIEKRIPMQAGLGGGSADAAAALLALTRLWQLEVAPRTLHAIAARLGADVPFFLEGGTALGTGRGDELRPLPDFPVSSVLVVMPPCGVPTADAYRWHDARVAARATSAGAAADAGAAAAAVGRWPDRPGQWPAWLSRCRNDFEPVVGERLAEVPEAVARLQASGATLAALSGSGAALFGLFASEAAADAAALGFDRPGWQTFVSRTLDRASSRPCSA